MPDDQIQRPLRTNAVPGRATPGERAPAAGNDPLAELARLIGQADPFGEFGQRRTAAPAAPAGVPPQPPAPAARAGSWPPPPSPPQVPGYAPRMPQAAAQPVQPAAPGFPPPPHAQDLYHTGEAEAAYADDAQHAHAVSYEPQAAGYGYDPNDPRYPAAEDDYYDDAPPRRRIGVLAIAAVFVLAVVGTAGAFGYRALFGTHASGPPPVIKADNAPIKVTPAEKSSAKLITSRVGNGGDEKLVPREELPVDIKSVPTEPVQAQGSVQAQAAPPAVGSGVVGGAEPKKVHTLVIRPDGSTATEAQASAAPPAWPPQQQQQEDVANAAPAAPVAPAPAPRHVAAPAPQVRAAPIDANAPLSLSPTAPTPTRAAPVQMHTASVAPVQPMAAGGSGYAVQLSSRKSEADAQAAFRSLAAKYPGQLGGKQPLIRRVDLGEKGVYFRAMVGPFGSSEEAGKLCSSLKAAGGSCFVQRI